VPGAGQADFQPFGFAEPVMVFGFADAGGQVAGDLGEAGTLGRVGAQRREAQAGLTEMILSWDASVPGRLA